MSEFGIERWTRDLLLSWRVTTERRERFGLNFGKSSFVFCIWARVCGNVLDQILEIKVAQLSLNDAPKAATAGLPKELHVFKIAEKVTQYLRPFCKKICHHVLSKVAQSDHTGFVLKEDKEWGCVNK